MALGTEHLCVAAVLYVNPHALLIHTHTHTCSTIFTRTLLPCTVQRDAEQQRLAHKRREKEEMEAEQRSRRRARAAAGKGGKGSKEGGAHMVGANLQNKPWLVSMLFLLV